MKRNLPTGACVLIALALVAFGLIYGTLSGYGDERARRPSGRAKTAFRTCSPIGARTA